MELNVKKYKGSPLDYMSLVALTMPKKLPIEISSEAFESALSQINLALQKGGYNNSSKEIDTLINKHGLRGFVSYSIQETTRGGLSFISIENLVVNLKTGELNLFKTPSRDKRFGVSLFIKNCTFQGVDKKSIYGSEIQIKNYNFRELDIYIEDCDFNNASLQIYSQNKCAVEIERTELLDLVVDTPGPIKLNKATVMGDLQFSEHVNGTHISNSWISSIDTTQISHHSSKLTYLYFDEKSYINENQAQTYRALRSIIKRPQLYNKIQDHIFYKKELGVFIKNTESADDRILFYANNFLNNNGTSFLKPIFLMLVTNCFFIFWLNTSISETAELQVLDILQRSIYMSLDISPINGFRHELTDMMYGVDGLRRILITLFSYSTISAAIRFRFKN